MPTALDGLFPRHVGWKQELAAAVLSEPAPGAKVRRRWGRRFHAAAQKAGPRSEAAGYCWSWPAAGCAWPWLGCPSSRALAAATACGPGSETRALFSGAGSAVWSPLEIGKEAMAPAKDWGEDKPPTQPLMKMECDDLQMPKDAQLLT